MPESGFSQQIPISFERVFLVGCSIVQLFSCSSGRPQSTVRDLIVFIRSKSSEGMANGEWSYTRFFDTHVSWSTWRIWLLFLGLLYDRLGLLKMLSSLLKGSLRFFWGYVPSKGPVWPYVTLWGSYIAWCKPFKGCKPVKGPYIASCSLLKGLI